ncbi:DUF6363 domain-containing protein [Laribacter hongkongensis]|uniref:patatin-like phospholipase family protein n=1 Tax=Laribacter hongkongensis TaxID=168471 RepID=UPI001EFDBF00|nr:patatin-like phospholipase family protein [Laribacter hongkongensis]MCG9115422.1 DUF6363 domain-containing protein [Laribacter hongkongensis]
MGFKLALNAWGAHHSTLPMLPYRKFALVCEGGGQRGIFTAGVLDAFLQQAFFPFELMIGTSAGAQTLSAYACGQHGYSRHVITRYTTTRDFFNPLRFLRGGHLIDLDWYVDTVRRDYPLDLEEAHRRLNGRELLFCACRQDDYRPVYLPAGRYDWLASLKASSAIPLLYRNGAEVGDVRYVDGGVRDAIPVREAWHRGADLILVIRTLPSGISPVPAWRQHMHKALSRSDKLQTAVQLLEQHERIYAATQHFIDAPPGDLRIIEIAPRQPLKSRVVGSHPRDLEHDYRRGTLCGLQFLRKIVPRLQQHRHAVPDGI